MYSSPSSLAQRKSARLIWAWCIGALCSVFTERTVDRNDRLLVQTSSGSSQLIFWCRKTMATQANYEQIMADLRRVRTRTASGSPPLSADEQKQLNDTLKNVVMSMEEAGWNRWGHSPSAFENQNRIDLLSSAASLESAMSNVTRPATGGRRTRKTRSTRRFFRRTRQWRRRRTTIKSAIRSRM